MWSPQKVGMHFLLSEEGSICFERSCAFFEKDELTSYNILPLGLKWRVGFKSQGDIFRNYSGDSGLQEEVYGWCLRDQRHLLVCTSAAIVYKVAAEMGQFGDWTRWTTHKPNFRTSKDNRIICKNTGVSWVHFFPNQINDRTTRKWKWI